MNNLSICISLLGMSITGVIVYKGYYYGKRKLQEYVMSKVLDELNNRMEKQDQEEMFKLIHTNSAAVKVTTSGKTHSIYVPYNRKRTTAMLRKKVYLMKDGEKIEIAQKPGIPYLVCAADLGGSEIIVEDLDGNAVHSFAENEIPNCF